MLKTTAAIMGSTIGAGYAGGEETWIAFLYATLGATVAYILVTRSINMITKYGKSSKKETGS